MKVGMDYRRGVAALCRLICCAMVLAPAFRLEAAPGAVRGKPSGLEADSLIEPMGIDSAKPMLSWRLQDTGNEAKQTAYEILVWSKAPTAGSFAKADLWNSGRVTSEVSAGVRYEGPALLPEHRYFWRVKVWDKDGRLYPTSDPSWWETGLLSQKAWKADWIGYEGEELHRVRTSGATWISNDASGSAAEGEDTHHDFRYGFKLDKPVKRAMLYTTGRDTAAAWVNGSQVMTAQPLPKWREMPWGTYFKADVSSFLRPGSNELAIEITRYWVGRRRVADTRTPMSACLYVLFDDGTTRVLTSADKGWRATLNASAGWHDSGFHEAGWKKAEPFAGEHDPYGGEELTDPWPTGPAALLRKNFDVKSAVTSARLYATALGTYKFHLNGAGVGDQMMAPGWMDFREHVPYQVYDVTRLLRPGMNAIGAELAAGWYSTPLRAVHQGNNYGETQPSLRAQLRIEHADGSVEWVATDKTWKATTSPTLFSELYDGETYDARMVQHGWDTASFDEASWQRDHVTSPKEPEIVAQYFPPIRAEKVMTAKAITSPSPGVYVFDFGQNLSGVPRLRVTGKSGQDIKLRFAEVLNPDGTIYVDNLRTAKATDHFLLAGTRSVPEEFQPQFTFHGFRYAEISGVSAKPTLDALKVVVLHTDAPFTTRFETGDAMVNKLWSNVLWGQRSNFVGVPTDCPQRDERLGWSADAQVFWRTASFNMDLTTFSQKYAADLHGTQVGTPMYGIYAPGLATANAGFGTGWSDAGVIVPWTGWIQSGNRRIVDENWDGMAEYVGAIDKANPDHLWRNQFGVPFGDWLTPTVTTPEDLIATVYFAYDVSLMRQMAAATGRDDDAKHYTALFEQIKSAFQKAYLGNDGFVGVVNHYPSIRPPTMTSKAEDRTTSQQPVETQTGYVLALSMDLVPKELRQAAAAKLVEKIQANNWMLGTGFLGTPYLLAVLSDTGHSEVAYRLLLNREYPSWGYLIDHGATTTWERWNGDKMRDDPSMNSYNHYAYGAVAEWMYRYAAGVDTVASDPGFHTIYLHPQFDARLGHLDFAYETPYGKVHSTWTVKGSAVSWTVTVPPNATAQLPVAKTNASDFRIDGVPLGSSRKVGHLAEDS